MVTSGIRSLDKGLVITPAETALLRRLVTETDLLRLKAIARLHARGLPPDMGWDDLLQEAFARIMGGSRRQPEGVALIVFIAGIMRSLKAQHWRRVNGGFRPAQSLPIEQNADDPGEVELCDPSFDPERSVIAWQELAAIDRLFADDALALQIIAGLAEGLSAEQIRVTHGIPKVDYDSARRRMRRILLREGLTSCQQR